MPKKNRNQPKTYSEGSIAAGLIIGTLLIALGAVILITVLGAVRGGVFDAIRETVYHLAGVTAPVLAVPFMWGGVLLWIGTRRRVSPRPLLLFTLVCLLICAFIELIAVVSGSRDYLMNQVWNIAQSMDAGTTLPNLLSRASDFALINGVPYSGGVIGYLMAFPLWKLLGPVMAAILDAFLIIGAVLALFRFRPKAFMAWLKRHIEARNAKQDAKEQQRQQAVWMNRQQPAAEAVAAPDPRWEAARQPQPQRTGFQPVPEETHWTPPPADLPPAAEEETPRTRKKPFISRIFGGSYEEELPEEEAPVSLRASRRPVREEAPADAADNPYRRPAAPPTEEPAVTPAPVRFTFAPEPEPAAPEESPRIAPAAPTRPDPEPEPTPSDAAHNESGAPTRRRRSATHATAPEKPAAPAAPKPSWTDDDDRPPWEEPPVKPDSSRMPVLRDQSASTGEKLNIKPVREGEKTLGGKKRTEEKPRQLSMYVYPDIGMLNPPKPPVGISAEEDAMRARKLEETLASFKVDAAVRHITHGPAVSRFELELAPGIKVSKVTGLGDNIAMNMEAKSVRIEAPIPGKSLVGIEVPNRAVSTVTLRELLESPAMQEAKDPLTVALGRDIAGTPIVCNLSKMPHLLIAGATGSGKSVCINAIINSLLYRCSPAEVRLILVDPKVVELQCYNGVPHLLLPVVSDPHKASAALEWAVDEMMLRYNKFKTVGVRNIDGYNSHLPAGEEKMARLVIIIDELADLMMVCKRDVEERICRLAQLARAAGIHLIVATQRPSVDVITGLIKANIPSRIAFKVTSYVDSRTILDGNGAEQLLGWGDMLYKPMGSFTPTRIQGCFLSDDEVNSVTDFIRSTCPADYDPELIDRLEHAGDEPADLPSTDDFAADEGGGGDTNLLAQAIEMAVQDGQVSTSMVQRRLRGGYSRAGRLVDEMEKRGIVSAQDGSKPRLCLISREEFEEMKAGGELR